VKMTREFIDASKAALKAAEAKNADGILTTGGDLNASCDHCHAKYQRQ
jgi:cytochrome c556